MDIKEMIDKAYEKNKNSKEELRTLAEKRLQLLNTQIIEALNERKEVFEASKTTWFDFKGKSYHFNIQLRDNDDHINMVMFVFDNAYMINRHTIVYEIESADLINADFDEWAISNTMKYLLMKN